MGYRVGCGALVYLDDSICGLGRFWRVSITKKCALPDHFEQTGCFRFKTESVYLSSTLH